MRVLSTVPAERLGRTNRLYLDYATRSDAPIVGLLGDFRASAANWPRVIGSRPALDARIVARLREYNAELGAPPSLVERIGGLADGSVRVVVTGQQPGLLGGPLLSLYKIATAVALARTIEERFGTPCVPVFWIGADDDDFAEVRDLVVLGSDLSVIRARVATTAYRPGLRVGDIEAAAAADAWKTVAELVAPGPVSREVADLAARAGDFGEVAARVILRLTGGAVAVVDGRDPALRLCARELLLTYFDAEPRLRETVDARGRALEALGYHAQLKSGEDSGLFLLGEGRRQRIPESQRRTAREAFSADIRAVSPGVVARNLLQDAVLSPAAVVLGPAEIAYRAQLVDVYRELALAMPVAVPRLSATFVPERVRALIEATGVDAALAAMDPAAFVRAAAEAAEDAEFVAAAQRFELALRREADVFTALAGGRLDARAMARLEKRLAEAQERLTHVLAGAVEQDVRGARARWPFLRHVADVFSLDGSAQERYLSLLVPFIEHGPSAWDAVRDLASAHAADALDGRLWHGVYSV